MNRFLFSSVNQIVFGAGEMRRVGELSSKLGRRAFIIHSKSASLDTIISQISKATTRIQAGEPTVQDVDDAIEQAKRAGCDCVIGYGGGSAIDAAKATAGLLTNGGRSVDYMEVVGAGQKMTRAALPWMAIPTTAGTGAEVTRNAVIGLPGKKFKASLRSEYLLATVALIDPELGIGVPPQTTAYSGMDALCQLIEAYTSSGASELTDSIVLSGLPHAAKSLRAVYADGANIAHRTSMAYAALLSGIALTNAGLGAVHGFAAPLGANFPMPHGAICAALLPHVIRANIAALHEKADEVATVALTKYATLGRLLTGNADSDACELFCSALGKEFNIPRLSTYGMQPNDVMPMVDLARKSSSMRYNPIQLSDAALAQILSDAL